MKSASYNISSNSNNNGGGGNNGYDLSFLGHLFTAAHDASVANQKNESKQDLSKERDSSPLTSSEASVGRVEREEADKAQQTAETSPSVVTSESSTSTSSNPDAVISHLPVDVSENETFVRIRLNVTGVKASDIKVDVQRGVLLIRGVRIVRVPNENGDGDGDGDGSSYRSTSSILKHHKFCRRYAIDTDVIDIHRIRANLSGNGVLTITGPKKNTPNSIQVQITENDEGGDEQHEQQQRQGEGRTTPSPTSMFGSNKQQRPVVDITPSGHHHDYAGRRHNIKKEDVMMHHVSPGSERNGMSSISSLSYGS